MTTPLIDLTASLSSGHVLFAFGMPGGWEWIILLVIGLLIFGRRLPEVGKWLGQGIVEFKKGIKGIDDEIDEYSSKPSAKSQPREPEQLADQSGPSRPSAAGAGTSTTSSEQARQQG